MPRVPAKFGFATSFHSYVQKPAVANGTLSEADCGVSLQFFRRIVVRKAKSIRRIAERRRKSVGDVCYFVLVASLLSDVG
jgi:hypothetical protein